MSDEFHFINGPLDRLDLPGGIGAVVEAFCPRVLNATFERRIVRLRFPPLRY